MPIYEFKCLNCNKYIEIFFTKITKKIEIKCNYCNSKELEKIISITKNNTTNFTKKNNESSFKTKERTCLSGNCTTYKIPGTY